MSKALLERLIELDGDEVMAIMQRNLFPTNNQFNTIHASMIKQAELKKIVESQGYVVTSPDKTYWNILEAHNFSLAQDLTIAFAKTC